MRKFGTSSVHHIITPSVFNKTNYHTFANNNQKPAPMKERVFDLEFESKGFR